jgi:hypothetical protein
MKQVHTANKINKTILVTGQAVEAHRVVRYRGSHIFYTIGSQMAVRPSALRAGHLGQFFMEPSDYYDAPINKVLHFI